MLDVLAAGVACMLQAAETMLGGYLASTSGVYVGVESRLYSKAAASRRLLMLLTVGSEEGEVVVAIDAAAVWVVMPDAKIVMVTTGVTVEYTDVVANGCS